MPGLHRVLNMPKLFLDNLMMSKYAGICINRPKSAWTSTSLERKSQYF